MNDDAGQDLGRWVDSVVDAMQDTVMMLGFDGFEVDRQQGTPEGLQGAHIALVGATYAVHLGVLSTARDTQRMAQAMLEAEEELPQEDVADAMGEIANILAGGLKGAMLDVDEELKLGLPVYVAGRFDPPTSAANQTLRFVMGNIELTIIVSVGRPEAKRAA